MSTAQNLPIDAESAATLAARGLRFDLVDTSSVETFAPWFHAIGRGFLDGRATDAVVASRLETARTRHNSGVWDSTAAVPESPVATIASWPTELTVPGRESVPAWAISAVSVSPTHRRRGIAAAMLTAELRNAKALGIPLAILTVSESTIYARWGFAPAAMSADWSIDPSRAKWQGPIAEGRVHFVEADTLLADGAALVERVRLETPGQIEFHGVLWERLLGIGDEAATKKTRFARYDDRDGTQQGFAVYSVDEGDFGTGVLRLSYLVAATDDAYAGLWRHFLEMDLIASIKVSLRSIDEPLRWQVTDFRAAEKHQERDHLWVRILDVPAALESRRYHSPGHFVLDVTDPQGYATGRFLLSVSSDGTAVVTIHDGDVPADADAVSLTVNELGAIYLGGVSPVLLAKAGRIVEVTPGAAAVLERTFRATVTPWLSIWF